MSEKKTDWLALGREVLDIEIQGLEAVRARLDESFVRVVEMLAICKGRVVVTGLGKSGLVGRKLAATFSSTGTPSFFLHPVEGAHGDMGMIRPEDVILAISNSGETDELNAILPAFRSLGATIIALTGCPRSSMGTMADAVLDAGVPREACQLNLAPTASTTATLALGDALAICLMELKSFDEKDFLRYHPGGSLGQRLRLKVRELMHTDNIPTAHDGATYGRALEVLNKGGLGTVLLIDESGRLKGIITDGDVRRHVCSGSLDPDGPASALMTADPCAATPDQSVAELLDIMERKAITVLPVVDGEKKVQGVVHLHDLLGKGHFKFSG